MSIIKLRSKAYSDVDYVDGISKHNPVVEYALQKHCKQYFDEYYRSVFFVKDEHKKEIFQESFITLWEKIEKGSIYVDEGVLKGKDGIPFKGKLTTYFMSIAKLKYLEWVRSRRTTQSLEENEQSLDELDMGAYKDLLYDEDDHVMLTIIADCVGHMSERCNQILTMFYYEEKTLDDIMIALPTFESKNALKTAKYKCLENLRKSAQDIYRRYLNS